MNGVAITDVPNVGVGTAGAIGAKVGVMMGAIVMTGGLETGVGKGIGIGAIGVPTGIGAIVAIGSGATGVAAGIGAGDRVMTGTGTVGVVTIGAIVAIGIGAMGVAAGIGTTTGIAVMGTGVMTTVGTLGAATVGAHVGTMLLVIPPPLPPPLPLPIVPPIVPPPPPFPFFDPDFDLLDIGCCGLLSLEGGGVAVGPLVDVVVVILDLEPDFCSCLCGLGSSSMYKLSWKNIL